ncbi:MAG: carbohydrate ABC transporter permease [Lachnospiraceae bacterium]|nr:carbohydrate ABC transporter permease [Lachnospiraceae bacterium]
MKKKTKSGQIVLHSVFIILTLMYLLPFLLVVSISFSSEAAILKEGFSLIPRDFTLDAYKMVFKNSEQIINSYRTTIIFSVVATALSLLVMGLMAYAMARPNYMFNRFLSLYVLFTMFFNGGMIPTYILIMKTLHLGDTIWVYIWPTLVGAYNLMILRTNYRSLPYELIEAAKMDGANELFICFRVAMPLTLPAFASVGFMYFVQKWNVWNASLLYIKKRTDLYSLQYLLQRILNDASYMQEAIDQGLIDATNVVIPSESLRYALAMVAAGPVLVIFPLFQKYFAKGLTIGGVKG